MVDFVDILAWLLGLNYIKLRTFGHITIDSIQKTVRQSRMGSRTIDEGSMDEKSGMNFSEYVAILSGNTDLLEKAKLEKKIAGLDSERQTFIRSKSSSRSRLDEVMRTVDGTRS